MIVAGLCFTITQVQAKSASEATEGSFSDGGLPPLGRELEFADELARRRLQHKMFDIELPAVRVGRFELERELGSGGMGTVWAAHDPQLGRTVALKFMRDQGMRDQGRMLEEARGLAKINHPHVVTVYDVGVCEGRVWIAMEWVAGQTLGALARSGDVASAECLAHWLEAGRGLAAIHAAGLVHRDVKPDNVLLGNDGRVRVIDLGLVCGEQDGPGQTSEGGSVDALGTRKSRALRGFAGTRAYAAPEQLEGAPLDARADQYAFAVSVVEALTGSRPRHPVDASTSFEGLGRRERRALLRALAQDPNERFVDMEALCEALAPPKRRQVLLASLTTGVLAAGLAMALAPRSEPPPSPCAAVARAIDEVWSPARQAAFGEALTLESKGRAREVLDDWAQSWRASARRSCMDSLVTQERSARAHDRRMLCLERHLDAFEVLLEAESSSRLGGPGGLVQGLSGLADPPTCLAEHIADGEVDPPPAELGDALEGRRRELLRMELVSAPMDQVQGRAAEIERWAVEMAQPSLAAEAALLLAKLERRQGHAEAARIAAGRGLDRARDLGALELEAEAWTLLLGVARDLEFDHRRATWALERRASAVQRLGSDPRQEARLLAERGLVVLMEDDLERGIDLLEQAEEAFATLGPLAAWERATTLHDLGHARTRAGDPEGALEELERARALELGYEADISDAVLSSTAKTLYSRGLAQLESGALEDAQASLELALERFISEQGPRAREVGRTLGMLAKVADARGDLRAAALYLERAQASMTSLGEMEIDRADLLSLVGTLAYREGRYRDAVEAFERVLVIRTAREPDALAEIALSRSNVAEALQAVGRPREALNVLALAVPTLEQVLGPEHPDLGYPLKARAAIELELGDPLASREAGLRALGLFAEGGPEWAETAELLARAASALGDSEGVSEHGSRALAAYAKLGPDWAPREAELARWVAAHDDESPGSDEE